MKKYEQPAIELIKFSVMDVLQTSTFDTTPVEGTNGKSSEENFNDMFGY